MQSIEIRPLDMIKCNWGTLWFEIKPYMNCN